MMLQFEVWNKNGVRHPPYLMVLNADKYDYLHGFWSFVKFL